MAAYSEWETYLENIVEDWNGEEKENINLCSAYWPHHRLYTQENQYKYNDDKIYFIDPEFESQEGDDNGD